jgi:hypothetical protein
VLPAALLGDDPLRDLVRRQPQRVHLDVRIGLVERGDHRLHVVVRERRVPGERALLGGLGGQLLGRHGVETGVLGVGRGRAAVAAGRAAGGGAEQHAGKTYRQEH